MQTDSPALGSTLQDAIAVSTLNHYIKALLETALLPIWIEGEVSNLIRSKLGHYYFSLIDPQSQVSCVLFTRHQNHLMPPLKNGLQLCVKVQVSLYPARGNFQLIVQQWVESGDGKLKQAYEALKHQLGQAGLFDPQIKKPLPPYPQSVAIVTSAQGAVLHDIKTVLARRYPFIVATVYPASVQGHLACHELIRALKQADLHRHDVILIARGGGSQEDLQPFNEEPVVRAVFACNTPVVSAIGHETDVSLTDFVADVRAPTPSAAAELITPDSTELLHTFVALQKRMHQFMLARLQDMQLHLQTIQKRIIHPQQRLLQQQAICLALTQRLYHLQQQKIQHHHASSRQHTQKLNQYNPMRLIYQLQQQQKQHTQQLSQQIQQHLHSKQKQFSQHLNALDALNPLSVLKRGYAWITAPNQTQPLAPAHIQVGMEIQARFAQATLWCEVKRITHNT